jgi:hypothetical protein
MLRKKYVKVKTSGLVRLNETYKDKKALGKEKAYNA